MIKLIGRRNETTILRSAAKAGTTLAEVCEIAENAVFNGTFDYARVEVDGAIYCEYEA